MSKRLNQIFTYSLVGTKESALRAHYHPKSPPPLLPDPSCWMGIEVEVENYCPTNTAAFPSWYWVTTSDHSLRGGGIEFISIPLRGNFLIDSVQKLEQYLKKVSPHHDFNRRTSVHVHVGVRYLTVRQLLNVVLTYLTVEPLLYAFAEKHTGYKRRDNNFCVPIAQSALSLNLPQILKECETDEHLAAMLLPKRWKKYTGLNLCPIATQGTIEFRHLGGTIDSVVLLQWLGYIQSLRGFGKNTSTEDLLTWINSLNSNSNYAAYVAAVLGPDALKIVYHAELKLLLEDSIETTKEIIGWCNRKSLVEISEQGFLTTQFFKRMHPKALTPKSEEINIVYQEKQINNTKLLYSKGSISKNEFFQTMSELENPSSTPLKSANVQSISLLEGL